MHPEESVHGRNIFSKKIWIAISFFVSCFQKLSPVAWKVLSSTSCTTAKFYHLIQKVSYGTDSYSLFRTTNTNKRRLRQATTHSAFIKTKTSVNPYFTSI
jgi:hypothetical protein